MRIHGFHDSWRRAAVTASAIFLAIIAGPLTSAFQPAAASVRRVTADGNAKYGITLCGDGSTAAWLEVIKDASLSPDDITVVKAAATGGAWSKEIFRYSSGAFLGGIKGPHYDAADRGYRFNLGGKILLSRDGKRVVLLIDEYAKSRHYDFFLVMDLPGGAARLQAPALPVGMGTVTGNTNYDSYGVWLTNGVVGTALSDDGRFVFFNVKAFGSVGGNGKTLDALVAMDLDAGMAVRVAGYQAMDAKGALTAGEMEYAETRLNSSGDRVAFACAGAYWVGDAKGSPLRRVAAGENNAPLLAGEGRYLVESHTGSFYPVDGGARVTLAVPGRGGFVFPVWDGQPGFILQPSLSVGEEVALVRASGTSALVKAGEQGLPAGAKFGVAAISSAYTYQLASNDGGRVLLSVFGADGKNDLYLAEQASAAPTPTARAVAPPAIPPAPPVPPTARPASPPRPSRAAVPGAPALAVGAVTLAASATVGAGGGEVSVTAPDSPIRGFSIRVPAGAYREARPFTVSTASITRRGLPPEVEIATPLIRVENGGAFAEIPLTLTIPVTAAAGSAVLAFYYDEATGKLEGMPLSQVSGDSITVLASHFSSFFVARMPDRLLPATIDSGFRPGVDDWQMINEGSFATPGGHCTGQSIMAMWYYFEKALRNEPRLYNRYDNNAIQNAATPGFWMDDSLAVRLIATVWRDLQWGSDQRHASLRLADLRANRTILNAFRLSMYLTGEPQLAEIFRFDTESNKWQGHAIVVYKVENDKLLVADPNFPGRADRAIEFDAADSRFKPYFSGETASSPGVAFPAICYVAKTALIPWAKLGDRWKEYERSFDAKPQENASVIGREYFPPYKLYIVEPEGRTELADYHVTTRDKIKVEVASAGNQIRVIPYSGANQLTLDSDGAFTLNPGYNEIGFYIQAATGGFWRWADFRRFKIYRNTLTIEPSDLRGKPGTTYNFTAHTGAGAAPADAAGYRWGFGDGSAAVTAPGPTTQHQFERPGRYTIALRAVDRQGQALGDASAVAIIEAEAAQPKPADTPAATSLAGWLKELKGIELIFRADYVRSDGSKAEGYEFRIPPEEADWYDLPIQWDGTTFHGTYERLPKQYSPGTGKMTVSGTVRQAGSDFFLDLEARLTETQPGSQDPPPYASTTVQEFVAKGIPLLDSNREFGRYLTAMRLEGDLVRNLAPTLVVNSTSHGESSSVKSIEWRGSSIRLEIVRSLRKRD
jgi:hypothetical protein